MAGNRSQVRKAALGYIDQALRKKAYFLDAARADDGWVVQAIVVEERQQKGAAPPKRWHVLYEVYLDGEFQPLYHVRRGYWEKALPAEDFSARTEEPAPVEAPRPEPALAGSAPPQPVQAESPPPQAAPAAGEAEVEPEGGPELASQGMRVGLAAPRAGDEGQPVPPDGGTDQQPAASATEQATLGEPESGSGVGQGDDQASREEAGAGVNEERLAPGEEVGEAEAGDEVLVETGAEETPEPGGAAEEEEGLAGLGEEPTQPGEPTPEEAAPVPPGPPAAPAQVFPTGPTRPASQEKQGPPKLTFHYTADEAVRKPE